MTQEATIARGGNLKRVAMGLVWAIVIVAVLQLARGPMGRADEATATKKEGNNAGAPVEFFPRPSPGEQEILAALEKPLTVEIVEEPLQDVVNDFADLLSISIVLDETALDDAAKSGDSPISLPRLKLTPAKSLLGLITAKYGIHYLVDDDMLLLTTKEVAEANDNLITRVYPVEDLAAEGEHDELVGAIIKSVDRNSWTEGGSGNGVIVPLDAPNCLVITQTRSARQDPAPAPRAARRCRQIDNSRDNDQRFGYPPCVARRARGCASQRL